MGRAVAGGRWAMEIRRWRIAAALALAATCLGACAARADQMETHCLDLRSVGFSSESGFAVRPLLEAALDEAVSRVDAVLYKLDDRRLLKALERAARRGVEVRLLVDHDEAREKGSLVGKASKAGARVRTWPKRQKMHAKLVVVDGQRAITGSFNWTERGAKDNLELVVDDRCPQSAAQLQAAFDRVWQGAGDD